MINLTECTIFQFLHMSNVYIVKQQYLQIKSNYIVVHKKHATFIF